MSGLKNQLLNGPKSELVLVIFVSLVLSFILFGNGIKGDFVLDDHVVVKDRPELSNIFNLPGIFKSSWLPGSVWISNYRPLTLWSFALNNLFSKTPAGFHVGNILIHAANVVLIFLLAKKLASRRVAYLTSILFLFLPIHVEAVTSIVGRKDILGAFFILLALLLFFNRKHIWASASFFLALLASDFSIAFLPLAAVLLLIENRSFIRTFKLGWYYVAPLPVYFALRYWALGKYVFGGLNVNPIVAPMAFLPFKERFFTGFYNFFLYLKKTVYPVNLSPDYSFNQIPAVHNIFSSPGALIGIGIFILLIAAFFLLRKEFKIAIAIFLVTFIVMSDIVFISGGSVAERRWYLPSFGLVLLFSLFIDFVISRHGKLRPVFGFLGAVVLLISSVAIINQNRIWLNDRNLFVAAAVRSPDSVWARTDLAIVYFGEKNYEGARNELEAAFKFSDNYTPALSLWGKLLWREGKYEQAEEAFKKAIDFDYSGKSRRIVYRTLAFLSFDIGKNEEAISYMEQALKSQPMPNDETMPQIDNALYEMLKKNRNRSINSYTPQEKRDINLIIKNILDL